MKPSCAAALALLAGCVNPRAEPPGSGHPANPAAAEAAPESRPDLLSVEAPSPAALVPRLEPPKTAPDTAKPTAEHLEKINRLPPDDRAVALAQAVCPVSGEPLGSMGVPRKVTAAGRTFFLCCKGCEPKLAADPQGIVRKLGNAGAPKEAGR